jgi:hypothetical protein
MRSSMSSPTKPRTMHARARIVQIIGSPPLVTRSTHLPIVPTRCRPGEGPKGWRNTKLAGNGTRQSENRMPLKAWFARPAPSATPLGSGLPPSYPRSMRALARPRTHARRVRLRGPCATDDLLFFDR